ncbi:MAG: carboxypeptidase-like regulatory domain-containing protein [Bacteroidetes bacterium]|nr:carboxypeptidase-like regulatory domain-containing protein [Bacteroidota bacterium]
MMTYRYCILFLFVFLCIGTTTYAQTGKITGTVVDQNDEPLPGVNVVIEGSTVGAVTDLDGVFSFLNIRPGLHTLRATFIGFTPVTVEAIRVAIELTTEVDIVMQEETVGLEEVVIFAEQPVIQRDIAASQRNIDSEEIQSGKYQTVAQVLTSQVAFNDISTVEDRPEIRGSFFDESLYLVDGVNYNDPLTNQPHYRANLDAVEEIKVQTGGFSAEYGDVRSGVINVVTREGGESYSGSINAQYSAPGYKHFGPGPFDFASPIVEPFVDPSLGAFEGGNAFFDGWNAVAASLPESEAHANAPMELYARYLWRHRSQDAIDELVRLEQDGVVQFADGVNPDDYVFHQTGVNPDYRLSATLGGPVPFYRPLKFFFSYDRFQSEYAYRFPQPNFEDQNFRGKLTTNLGSGKKLNVHGYYSSQKGGTGGQGPGIGGFISSNPFSSTGSTNKYWYPDCAVPGNRTRQIYGSQWTHAISANTYYELQLTHDRVDYGMDLIFRNTAPIPGSGGVTSSSKTSGSGVDSGRIGTEQEAMQRASEGQEGWENWRNWALIRIGQHWYDEAPKGYGPVNWRDVTGEYRMESCNLRADQTDSRGWDASGNFTSQIDQNNQLRAGVQFRTESFNQYYEAIDPSVNAGNVWDSNAQQMIGAVYLQNKLEFEGFVATVGVRLDVLNTSNFPQVLDGCNLFENNGDFSQCAGGEQSGPWTPGTYPGNTTSDVEGGSLLGIKETIVSESIGEKRKTHARLSPRIGVSHPISTVAKVFFNYGHFYQWPNAFEMYRLRMDTRRGFRVVRLGNPLLEPERTIQYEVGYEQNLFNSMNLRMTGYYKNINGEIADVRFYPISHGGDYRMSMNSRFRDVRGFEAFLELRRGVFPYVSGWLSFNYLVESGAGYGYTRFYEDPVRQPLLANSEVSNADVRPIVKGSVNFHLPDNFIGPRIGDMTLLGGLNISVTYTWRRGRQFTWNPAEVPLVEDNLRWIPYQRWDMRFSKSIIKFGDYETAFYIDVSNLFNTRNLASFVGADVDNSTGWAWDGHKWWRTEVRDYMESLGYSADNQAPNDPDGAFSNTIGNPGDWNDDQIDLPAFSPWSFLERRDVFFGLRVNF